MSYRSSTFATQPLATLVLDPDVLRRALIAALSDASVLAHLSALLRGGSSGMATAALTFMNGQEYAEHARMSRRSLDQARQNMTEGVHYSRNGRKVRYHVAVADEFLSKQCASHPVLATNEPNLKELAREEVSKRKVRLPTEKL